MTKKIPQPFDFVATPVSKPEWRALEKAGGVALNAGNRRRLEEAVTAYQASRAGYKSAMRPGEIRPFLDRLGRSLEDASNTLEELLSPNNREGNAALRQLHKQAQLDADDPRLNIDFAGLRRKMSEMASQAKRAADALPEDRGKPKDDDVLGFLYIVTRVFAAAGGKGVYTTSALAFVEVACRLAGYRIQSQDALKVRVAEMQKLARSLPKRH